MTDTNLTPRPRGRWLLYTSLFLNVVFLTVIAMGAWNVMKFRERVELGMGPWMPRQIERALPDESRPKIRAIREANREAFRALFRAARASHEAVRSALEAEPFDAQALSEALKTKAQAELALSTKSAEIVVEIVSTLTPEERQHVRDSIDEQRPRKSRDRERDGDRRSSP